MRVADDPARPALRPLLRLAGPVVLSRLGIMAMGVVDTVVVGRYSAEELGYHAIGWAPTGVVLTTALGLLYGIQVMTSQAIGDGRAEETGVILRRGVAYAFQVGVAAALVLVLLGGPALHLVGLEPALADGATPVLQALALSLVPILVADAGLFWLEAHGRAVPGMVAMWAANLVNLGLNLWLVPGNSGFPVAGAVASAWSTGLSRLVLMVLIWVVIARWAEARRFGVFDKTAPDPQAAAAQRAVGYGTAGSYFIESAAFGAMSIFAGWLGTLAVATWAIVLNVAAVIFMVPLGLAAATAVMVGRAHGARSPAGVRRAAGLGFGVTVAVLLAICLGVGLGNEALAAAYTSEPTVRGAAAAALLLSCLFYVGDGLQAVGAQALRARGDVWMPTATHFASYLFVMMPLGWALALPLGLGLMGLVWAVIVASALSALLLWGRFWWLGRGALV
ncbi:MAG: MATE family efflux transporter [Polymorphobacter sp.]|uniref:MATE family efflux transporter n=1 Tax=Polymorphobacter sp. TaxID=1909290 RepID=UPI003A8AF83D